MRARASLAAPIALLVALGLAGCAGDPEPTPSPHPTLVRELPSDLTARGVLLAAVLLSEGDVERAVADGLVTRPRSMRRSARSSARSSMSGRSAPRRRSPTTDPASGGQRALARDTLGAWTTRPSASSARCARASTTSTRRSCTCSRSGSSARRPGRRLEAAVGLPASDPDRERIQIARLGRSPRRPSSIRVAEKFLSFIVAEVIHHHEQIASTGAISASRARRRGSRGELSAVALARSLRRRREPLASGRDRIERRAAGIRRAPRGLGRDAVRAQRARVGRELPVHRDRAHGHDPVQVAAGRAVLGALTLGLIVLVTRDRLRRGGASTGTSPSSA